MFKHYLPSFVFDCANTFQHILHSITRGMNSPFFYWPSKPQPPLLQILCRRRTTESGYAGGCTSFLTTRSDQQDHTRFPLNMCMRCCIVFFPSPTTLCLEYLPFRTLLGRYTRAAAPNNTTRSLYFLRMPKMSRRHFATPALERQIHGSRVSFKALIRSTLSQIHRAFDSTGQVSYDARARRPCSDP